MEKKVLSVFLLCLTGLFLMNFVSADISIGQPNEVYNLGDEFAIPIIVSSPVDANDFLTMQLACSNSSVDLFKSPLYIPAGVSKNISLDIKLDQNLIADSTGNCYISSSFASQSAQSQSFEITSRIDVVFLTDNSLVSPNQQITITGTALRASGDNANGYVVAQIEGLNSSTTSTVSDGAFSLSLVIPSDAPAKDYNLNVRVFEKENQSSFSNKGQSSSSIKVKQVVKSIDVATDQITLIPPYNLSAKVLLFDQSGEPVYTDAKYILFKPNSSISSDNKIVKSGDSIDLELASNAVPGYWTIEGDYGSLSIRKTFFVEESQKISFTLINQTLSIKNIGNVPYTKSLDIKIGNETQTQELNLALAEEKTFKLSAPNGNYSIAVKEGSSSTETSIGSSYLTGNAISVKDLSVAFSGTAIIISWLLVVLILLFIAYKAYVNVRKNHFIAKTPSKFSLSNVYSHSNKSRFIPVTKESFPEKKAVSQEDKPIIRKSIKFDTYSPDAVSSSYSSNMLTESSSNKEEVVVVALKLKNADKLRNSESPALAVVEHALERARKAKAKVYDQGDFKVLVFAQRVTQKLDNSLEAIKMAVQIESIIKDFNKKYAIKIDYGLGANIGEMFVEFIDGKVKFTSSGNTTIVAKNAAEKAHNELLLSSALHRKAYNVLKGEQTPYGLFKVNSLLDRSSHSQFISKFMKKQDK